MLRAVVTRRNKIKKHILAVNSLSPKQQTNEDMCLCYILTFGAIQYMIESLLRGWVHHNLRKHKYPYKDKPKVDYIISVLTDLAELDLKYNNAIKYSTICDLVGRLTGNTSKDEFKRRVEAYPGGSTALGNAIKRIEVTRHSVSHGELLPEETSPNLAELEKDFEHIYNCLIYNLDIALPRK